METNLSYNTTADPQTNGQTEKTVQTLEEMLWACELDFGNKWIDNLFSIVFSYNNSYHGSIGLTPFDMNSTMDYSTNLRRATSCIRESEDIKVKSFKKGNFGFKLQA